MPSPAPGSATPTATGHNAPRLAYATTFALLGLALLFPVALMVFNPTLMFERGWEQYVGTAIYVWAVLTLGRELIRLWPNEPAFDEAPPAAQGSVGRIDRDRSPRPAVANPPARLVRTAHPVEQLMELNREGSGLDQEQAAGRFTLTRYILYLLPVIGFIGTVEGISQGADEHQPASCRWSRTSTDS